MAPEKYIGALFSILVSASYGTPTAIAQGAPEVRTQMENARAPHPHMKEDVDGDLQAGE